MLFPTKTIALRCQKFMSQCLDPTVPVRVIELTAKENTSTNAPESDKSVTSNLGVVFFPQQNFPVAKQFWQHSGDGISSRRAEFCQRQLDEGRMVDASGSSQAISGRPKGPKRYATKGSTEKTATDKEAAPEGSDATTFLEERFGRNLGFAFVRSAKVALRRRIAGTLKSSVGPQDALKISSEGGRDVEGFTEDDVFLYPTGMSAIFNTHRSLLEVIGERKSVCYRYGKPMSDHHDIF